MAFGNIFDQIRDALDGNDEQRDQEHGFGNVLPASEDPYGDPADNGMFGNVLPASQDPYGDPADDDSSVVNVLPASMDPYGDPADQDMGYGNVLPSSEDPYGDPADQEQHQGGGGILDRLFGR